MKKVYFLSRLLQILRLHSLPFIDHDVVNLTDKAKENKEPSLQMKCMLNYFQISIEN